MRWHEIHSSLTLGDQVRCLHDEYDSVAECDTAKGV